MAGFFARLFGSKNKTEIKDAIKQGAFIVDVRTPAEFSSGSVKNAVNIPLDKIPNQLKKFKNKNGIVLFCRSGARSGSAKRILESNGFDNVYNAGSIFSIKQMMNEI